MSEYLCPDCGADLDGQSSYLGYDHVCEECGAKLHRQYSTEDFELVPEQYLCPNCGTSLYTQSCYSDYEDDWVCEECGRHLHREYGCDPYVVTSDDDEYDNEGIVGSYSAGNDSTIGAGGTLLAIGAIGLFSHLAKKRREEENALTWLTNVNAWKVMLVRGIMGIVVLSIIVGGFLIEEHMKRIDVTIDSDDVIGQHYNTVEAMFENAGFSYITTEAVPDLSLEEEELTGTVVSVAIDGTKVFRPDDKFPRDDHIVIYYHVLKLIAPPVSAKDAKGENYETVLQKFKEAGFVNIRIEARYDLVLGWFSQEGEIAEISIGGDAKFKTDTAHRPDVEVVIIYHDYKKDGK